MVLIDQAACCARVSANVCCTERDLELEALSASVPCGIHMCACHVVQVSSALEHMALSFHGAHVTEVCVSVLKNSLHG